MSERHIPIGPRTLIAVLLIFTLFLFSCTDEGITYHPDGDDPSDGDASADGDDASEDGDLPVILDGDEAENDAEIDGDQEADGDGEDGEEDTDFFPDGDAETDESSLPAGVISGTLRLGEDPGSVVGEVVLFDSNPMLEENTAPVAEMEFGPITGAAEKAFRFDGLESGFYYLMAVVANYSESGPELSEEDYHHVLYTDPIEIRLSDPQRVEYSDADLYYGYQDPALGQVSGTLHIGADLQVNDTMVLVSRMLPGDDFVEFWPSRIQSFPGEAGSELRDFSLDNLPDGEFYLIAISERTEEEDLLFFWPYNRLTISLPNQGEVTGVDFYLGQDNPSMGSISGEIVLSAALPEAEIHLLLFDHEPQQGSEPFGYKSLPGIQNQTRIDYQVGNIPDMDSLHISVVIEKPDVEGWAGDLVGPLTIDSGNPALKDLEDVDFFAVTSAMVGQIALSNAPTDFDLAALLLVDEQNGSLMVAGGGEFPLDPPQDGKRTGAFHFFPVNGGEHTPVVILDTNNDGIHFAEDIVCFLDPVTIDESMAERLLNLDVDFNDCGPVE